LNKSRILQTLEPFIELLKQYDAPYFYFAGGCLRNTLLGKAPNDYDIFTTSLEDAHKLIVILKDLHFQEIYRTENSVKLFLLNSKVDISLEFFTQPANRFDHFDFTINCIAFDSNYKLYYQKNFFEHLSDLSLVKLNTKPPLLELRYIKFLDDGFYSDFKPSDKIAELDIVTEGLWSGKDYPKYPKINLQKFCNNKL
tara:strand:+ start:77 stop:667 length:591 start_codon:yes stop_codon:yes gene_type:complete